MDDHYVLRSGRAISANRGIFGLGPDGHLYEGYDGVGDEDLTPDERRELADVMIARWQHWAEHGSPER